MGADRTVAFKEHARSDSVHATDVGKPGVPPFIPPLTNAIFNASGKRIRNLPIGELLRAWCVCGVSVRRGPPCSVSKTQI
jgi:CO/xanthine dehydrogenase Mo-binding subunit